jgi:hypothetical protein
VYFSFIRKSKAQKEKEEKQKEEELQAQLQKAAETQPTTDNKPFIGQETNSSEYFLKNVFFI